MSKYAGEEVLVVPRALLDEIGTFDGIRTAGLEAAVARLLDPASHFFMDRAAAEEDPSHKQLIPYCVFRCGDRILHYTRGKSGGESRLARQNFGRRGRARQPGRYRRRPDRAGCLSRRRDPRDRRGTRSSRRASTTASSPCSTTNPIRWARSISGIVHLVDLKSDAVSSREDALADLGFMPLADLNGALFERSGNLVAASASGILAGAPVCDRHDSKYCSLRKTDWTGGICQMVRTSVLRVYTSFHRIRCHAKAPSQPNPAS